ncbi:MAG: hypothetical protein AB1689_13830 [Thermodesulfobacteriota bacterium]
MFGFAKTQSIKLERDLYDRVKKIADVAGYATVEEFVAHVLEKEMIHFEDAKSDDDIRNKLRGLGYIS